MSLPNEFQIINLKKTVYFYYMTYTSSLYMYNIYLRVQMQIKNKYYVRKIETVYFIKSQFIFYSPNTNKKSYFATFSTVQYSAFLHLYVFTKNL